MKIFITASKDFYGKVSEIKNTLEAMGHEITPPNGYDEPEAENEYLKRTPDQYSDWKAEMIREDGRIVARNDAVLVLNFEKRGIPNYIGGATFLEMFKAFDLDKKLYLYNPIPDNLLTDEIIGLKPVVINGDLSRVV